jgi:hypothetical protein
MVDLDAMDKDPWPTWPVDKQELRILVEENEKLRAANVYLCSRVDYLPYCHEIERLRAALRDAASYLDRLEANMLQNGDDMLLDECDPPSLVADRLRAALAGEKTND